MKLIKFDLPLNGTKIRNLEELRDNFTTEILELYNSGVLSKWLKSRNLMTEADKLSAIPADYGDADKLVGLCETFDVEADRKVIEAALSKGQTSQGVALRVDQDELKYKEKFEKLSGLLDGLKRKKLYISKEDYSLFVKDKIQIEQEGEVECVVCSEAIFDSSDLREISFGHVTGGNSTYFSEYTYTQLKQVGDIVEVGDIIINISIYKTIRGPISAVFKSPLRGILVEMGDIPNNSSYYRKGDPICYIRIDHDTAPTIKIISD